MLFTIYFNEGDKMSKLMNKKRKIILIIALFVIFITGAVTTTSYLYSKRTFDNNVTINVGFINLTTTDATWAYTSSGVDINSVIGTPNLTETLISYNGKLRPGDTFQKSVSVTNTGDLPANIKLSPNISTELSSVKDNESPKNNLFEIYISDVTVTNMTLPPSPSKIGETYEILNIDPSAKVNFTINFEVNKDFTEVNGSVDRSFNNSNFSVIVDAVQTNGPFQ